jgi:hypothetical protein
MSVGLSHLREVLRRREKAEGICWVRDQSAKGYAYARCAPSGPGAVSRGCHKDHPALRFCESHRDCPGCSLKREGSYAGELGL